MDYGEIGADATLKALLPSITLGYGNGIEAYSIKIISINEKRIGLLSLTQKEFGSVEYGDLNNKGTALINSSFIESLIKEAKPNLDYLIVFPHAGLEHYDAPLPQWRNVYHRLIDYGADAVVASHPHVPQGWELYNDKPIFYSLGNFFFDMKGHSHYWNKSLCVKFYFSEVIEFEVINISFSEDSLMIDYGMDLHNKYLNGLLVDEHSYLSYLNKAYKEVYPLYRYKFLKAFRGVSFFKSPVLTMKIFVSALLGRTNEEDLLNSFQCETHRWTLENCLKMTLYK